MLESNFVFILVGFILQNTICKLFEGLSSVSAQQTCVDFSFKQHNNPACFPITHSSWQAALYSPGSGGMEPPEDICTRCFVNEIVFYRKLSCTSALLYQQNMQTC